MLFSDTFQYLCVSDDMSFPEISWGDACDRLELMGECVKIRIAEHI